MMKRLLLPILLLLSSTAWATNWCADANIEVCYTLEETSGDAIDQSSNGYDGTLVGTVTQNITGKFGQGYDLDGGNSYIRITDVISPTSITLVGWIKSDKTNTEDLFNNQQDVWALRPTHSTTPGFSASIDVSSTYYDVRENSSIECDSGGSTWCHAALTYGSNTLRGYRDGVEVGTSPNTSMTGDLDAVTGNTHIGIHANGSSNDVDGDIDEIAIFNDVKSSTDINDIMDNGLVQVAGGIKKGLILDTIMF